MGELLARWLLDGRLLRHRPPADSRLVQLSPAVSRTDPHRDAGTATYWRAAPRGYDRRGRSGTERDRGARAARAASCRPCDLRRERSGSHQAAWTVRGERI